LAGIAPDWVERILPFAIAQEAVEFGIGAHNSQGKFLLVNGNDLALIHLVQQSNGAEMRLS
jgi:hypothetical protein